MSLRCLHALALVALAGVASAAEIPLDRRESGYQAMGRETRAMQDDDAANPGSLWLLDGEALWTRKTGQANKACSECHKDAVSSMRGVASRYPAFDSKLNKALDLEARINHCRAEYQKAEAFPFEHKDLLALTAYVARQSRGMPIEEPGEKMKPVVEQGRKLFEQRQGQINLSCAQCHDDNWGRKLAGAPIPQGHPNGYPLYRLEWQTLGSLQRRLRNCIVGMRAEPYAFGSSEYIALEAFLMYRARGMKMESPAVRP